MAHNCIHKGKRRRRKEKMLNYQNILHSCNPIWKTTSGSVLYNSRSGQTEENSEKNHEND